MTNESPRATEAQSEQTPTAYLMKWRNGTRERLVRSIPTAKELEEGDYSDAEYIALGPISVLVPASTPAGNTGRDAARQICKIARINGTEITMETAHEILSTIAPARELDVEAELTSFRNKFFAEHFRDPNYAEAYRAARTAAQGATSQAGSAQPSEPDAWGVVNGSGRLEHVSRTRAVSEGWLQYDDRRKLVALDIRRTPNNSPTGDAAK